MTISTISYRDIAMPGALGDLSGLSMGIISYRICFSFHRFHGDFDGNRSHHISILFTDLNNYPGL